MGKHFIKHHVSRRMNFNLSFNLLHRLTYLTLFKMKLVPPWISMSVYIDLMETGPADWLISIRGTRSGSQGGICNAGMPVFR